MFTKMYPAISYVMVFIFFKKMRGVLIHRAQIPTKYYLVCYKESGFIYLFIGLQILAVIVTVLEKRMNSCSL